ncbi:MAG: YMGG-like glycine zipper-containing protein [Methylococcales bacterium]|nr:YMGG-like glycine zipper-containing protein [Methylococcales bacterium]
MIVFAVLLSACANQSQQTKTEGTFTGAAIGAGIGSLIGLAAGEGKGAAIGAGAGALLGGMGGFVYANNIDKHHQELLGKEDDLDTQIQVARNINNDMQESNRQLQVKIAEFNRDINSLQAEAGSQTDKMEKLKAKKQEINEEHQNVQIALASAKKELNSIAAFRASSAEGKQSKVLDEEHVKLVERYKQLQEHSTALASMSQRI